MKKTVIVATLLHFCAAAQVHSILKDINPGSRSSSFGEITKGLIYR